MRHLRTSLCIAVLCISCITVAGGQRRSFSERAEIKHLVDASGTRKAVVEANDPRPLWQAVLAVRQEYGLVINYEDAPITDPAELHDNSVATWRAEHPGERGYIIVKGGNFSSTYSDLPISNAAAAQELVLKKIVSDYNKSGYPGKYVLRKDEQNRYSVIGEYANDVHGQMKKMPPILDTAISLPRGTRTVYETIHTVLDQLSAQTGMKVAPMDMPITTVGGAQVQLGGTIAPARTWLLEALTATGRPLLWELLYDPNDECYYISVYVATKVTSGPKGERWIMPIDITK